MEMVRVQAWYTKQRLNVRRWNSLGVKLSTITSINNQMALLGVVPQHSVVCGAAGALDARVRQQIEVEETWVGDGRVDDGACVSNKDYSKAMTNQPQGSGFGRRSGAQTGTDVCGGSSEAHRT